MLGVIAKLTIKPGSNADFEATMNRDRATSMRDSRLRTASGTVESRISSVG